MRSGTEYVGGAIALGDAVQLAVANVPQNTRKFLHFKEIIRNAIADAHCRELCVENCSPAIMTLAFEKYQRRSVASHVGKLRHNCRHGFGMQFKK